MSKRRITMNMSVVVFALLLLLPVYANAWTTVTDNYDYATDDKTGGGWTEFDYNAATGDIEIEHDQWILDADCDIWIGEKITTPSYGGNNWKIKFQVKYRRSYYGWASWGSDFDIVIKAELQDSSHGVDWSVIMFSKVGQTDLGEDTTHLKYCYPSDILDEDTDYYIVYHLWLNFHGWTYMHEYDGSGYTTARFDLMYFKYEFYQNTGGDGPS